MINHGVTVSNIADTLGSKKSAYDHLAKCFYISNMGNNDYINNYLLPQSSDIRAKYNPDQFAALLIEKYNVQIKRMYDLGARKVGLVGVSPIGCTPSAIATSGGTKGLFCDDSVNRIVEPFNARLRSLVDRFNVDFPDAKFVYLDSTTANTLAGLVFPIRTEPCCEVSSVTGLCIPNSVPCSNLIRHTSFDLKSPPSSLVLIIVVAVLGIVAADGSSRRPEVPCYFIFGDSLSDSGNNLNLQTLSKVNYPPYGVDFPAGPTGRYTNGRTSADIVGELLGFDNFIPPFASKPNGSELLVGVNYASGSAGILVESGKQQGENIDMSRQLRNHNVTRMHNLGARKIGLAGLLPIGCSPIAIALAGGTNNSLCVDSLNQLVEPFNVRLQLLVDQLNVDFPDSKFMYLNSTLAGNLAIQV
ncbi:GDSL esterase/lipase At5g45670 [Linum perenne]